MHKPAGSHHYRADIDGLRAVSVVAVIAYHTGLGLVPGGYVGVDVFFVISGYLITSIILAELKAGHFSFARFYERRVRRLFPALLTVISVTLAAGWFVLLPQDFEELAGSSLSALAFVSNVYFWMQLGYFAPQADLMPLLHTWSLAIEEQFYIFFPVLLVLAFRWVPKLVPALFWLTLIVSLLLSVLLTDRSPSAAFYLIPTRAWELALGAVIAGGGLSIRRTKVLPELLATLGLLMIGSAIFLFDHATPFPGLAALLPAAGAAAIIVAGEGNNPLVSRMLSLRPFVLIGLLSYSLYLWHWPVMALMRHYFVMPELGYGLSLVAVVLTVVLSLLSYKLIETPLRRTVPKGWAFGYVGAMASLVIASSVAVVSFKGFPQRLPDDVTGIAGAAMSVSQKSRHCLNTAPSDPAFERLCSFGNGKTGKVPLYLWGDSHAAALLPALEYVAAEGQTNGSLIALNACPPLAGVAYVRVASVVQQEQCTRRNQQVLEYLLQGREPGIVILTARWESYVTAGALVATQPGAARSEEVLETALGSMIDRLLAHHKTVVIVHGLPTAAVDLPWAMALAHWHGTAEQPGVKPARAMMDIVESVKSTRPADRVINVDLGGLLCRDGVCKSEIDGVPIYSDSNHLAKKTARDFVGPYIMPALKF